MFRLDGKTAIVTGAGSGIGEAIAQVFAQQGAWVAAFDLDDAAVRRTADGIEAAGGAGGAWRCDVADAGSVRAAVEDVVAARGRLDILVNNAGIPNIGTVETTSEEKFDAVFRVNVKGVFLCTQAAMPHLVKSSGVILNMASIASMIGVPERFAYSMSKGAVLTMTMSVAIDYMKRVRCNCICPTRTHTPFVDRYVADTYPGREAEMIRKLSEYQPMGRMATPLEVAQLALYLCSDEASLITGQAFPIDGGVLVT